MTTPLEHRYRRLLRPLPTGYRQAWEEDMVTTLLERGRLTAGERLSVVTLAVRLRLAGTPTSSTSEVLRRALYGFALVVAFHQAIAVTEGVSWLARRALDADPLDLRKFVLNAYAVPLSGAVATWAALLWVAVFCCLVAGRVVASRVLVVTLAVVAIGLYSVPAMLGRPISLGGAVLDQPFGQGRFAWAVFLASTVVVLLAPRGLRVSWAWLAGPVAVSVLILAFQWSVTGWLLLLTLVAMLALLVAPAPYRSPARLLALAPFGVGLTLFLSFSLQGATLIAYVVVSIPLLLGLACAVVGTVALWRRTGVPVS